MNVMTREQTQRTEQTLKNHLLSRGHIHSASMLLGEVMQHYPAHKCSLPDTPAATAPEPGSGSGRRRLWELSSGAACPITGVCLQFHELQKWAGKHGLLVAGCSEYQLHVLVLQACRSRSTLTEQLQRELDRRFARQIQQAQAFKTTEALSKWWEKACQGVDWAGEFWATVSHPRCSDDLEHSVLGQVHMLQHQLGLAARVEASQLKAALAANQRLTQELAAARQRLQAQASEQAAALEALRAESAQLRASLIRAEARRDLAPAPNPVAQNMETKALSRQRQAEGKQRVADHNEKLLMRALQRDAKTHDLRPVKAARTPAPAEVSKAPPSALALDLADRSVLCVGGRTQGIPVYRQVVENRGARFFHHDGGEEDKASRLGKHLQAADLVICQVACISHSAYWRVKEHCKRTGKTCLFVEMPSRSALERALGQLAANALLTPV